MNAEVDNVDPADAVEPNPEASIDESLYLLLASGLLFSYVYFRKRVKYLK